MNKTIGIIGGMGPAATADLMLKIVNMTDADCDQDHIHVIVDSNTAIPDRTAAILGAGEDPVPELVKSAQLLETAGADLLIIPCNTAHWFIEAIRQSVSIPVLDMTAETACLLGDRGIKTAAVLATEGTVKCGIYTKALEAKGITAIYPDDEQEEVIMSLIYDKVKKGIMDPGLMQTDEVKEVMSSLRGRGAQAILLACTELPPAFDVMGIADDDCVDPTAVLAAAAIKAAGARLK